MRTQKEQIQNFLKGCLFGFAIVTTMFVTTGCPDEGKKTTTGYRRGGYWGGGGYGGRGYGGNGIVESVGIGMETGGRADLILEFATDRDPMYPTGTASVWAEGELNVYEPIGCLTGGGYNGLDAGIYHLYPYNNQPGQAMGDMYSNMVLVAEGRYGDALINVSYMKTFNNYVCGGNEMGMMGQIDIIQANGYPCGTLLGITDMNPGMCR